MVNKPLVSVVIPTYKRSEMLGRAIESVLNQTYSNIEVIVVDDNNNGDEFRKATEDFMKKYSQNEKIKYIKHSHNKNGAAARNTGIKIANGEYISFLDDDDFYLPKKIERQVIALTKNKTEFGAVCCLHIRRYKKFAYYKSTFYLKENGNYIAEILSNKITMPSSTLLLKKEVFQKIGGFDESFNRHQDLEFLVRFYRSFKMEIVPEYLVTMQIEGFRNYPSGIEAHQNKNRFFEVFKNDLNILSIHEKKEIYHYHWLSVTLFYMNEFKIKRGLIIYKTKVINNSNSIPIDFLKIILFMINSFLPIIKKIFVIYKAIFHLRKYSFNSYYNYF
jgi:glycosyltransferase involved in cell wall biosynthesis